MSLLTDKITAGIRKINFSPHFFEDNRYKVWLCTLSVTTCKPCFKLHGKIFLPSEAVLGSQNLHEHCACRIVWSASVKKGTATFDGKAGVDFLLCSGNPLPKQYLTKSQAKKLGWNPLLMNLRQVTANGVIGGDVYKNLEGKLPADKERIWYEADINYTGGARNSSRIIFSNDGLVFVTYDHYLTFNEIY